MLLKKGSHARKCMVKVEMKGKKLSEEIREGIECHLAIKEKRLKQSEASRQYSVCDCFLDEIRELKSVK